MEFLNSSLKKKMSICCFIYESGPYQHPDDDNDPKYALVSTWCQNLLENGYDSDSLRILANQFYSKNFDQLTHELSLIKPQPAEYKTMQFLMFCDAQICEAQSKDTALRIINICEKIDPVWFRTHSFISHSEYENFLRELSLYDRIRNLAYNIGDCYQDLLHSPDTYLNIYKGDQRIYNQELEKISKEIAEEFREILGCLIQFKNKFISNCESLNQSLIQQIDFSLSKKEQDKI